MTNWRVMRTLSLIILGVTALTLFGMAGILGIENLSDKVFGTPISWEILLGAGQLYVLWAFNRMIRA